MLKTLVILSLVATPLAAALAAKPVDNYAAAAIAASQFDAAEALLNDRLRVAPADQPALLNLAHVYRHTARPRQANVLYSRVLARSDVKLAKADGSPVWAHDVARVGLTGTVSIALR